MALFRGTLGMEAWYFLAVTGLIIEDSKCMGPWKPPCHPGKSLSAKREWTLGV